MTVSLHLGNCLDVMRTMPDNSVDSIVTDPPYGLNFMGKKWDCDVPSTEIWAECLRVLKPGGHLLAFAGTRTQHRMAVRIEDAGFEIRDMIAWVYGSGFPKSLDVSKAIDKAAGHHTNPSSKGDKFSGGLDRQAAAALDAGPEADAAQQWKGWGTALKPALEPITLARKPLIGTVAANVLAHGTGALNIDGCRISTTVAEREWQRATARPNAETVGFAGMQKPAGFNPGELGRWPANLIHDGSDEVLAGFPDSRGKQSASICREKGGVNAFGVFAGTGKRTVPRGDIGSAARFFYCAKASKADRNDGATNNHPTVKPTDLMRYLCRLVTPPGGVVLDPFTGSGSTGRGAVAEGFRFIGIDMDADNIDIARARIHAMQPGLPLEAA